MGTSSIFNGRNDRNPLLPDNYTGGETDNQNIFEPVKWKTVKTDMSKFIKSGGTYSSNRHIAGQYVRAAGGAHRLAAQSRSGIRAGANIGGFFNSIRTNGVENTLQNLGVELEGKSVKEVFSRLADTLAPDSSSKEDVIAREAVQSALSQIYDYVEDNGLSIDSLNEMPPELMNEALCDYTGSYIWIMMMNDLGSRLEMHLSDAQNAFQVEREFKDMIMGIVKVEFANEGDIINQNVDVTMGNFYERCLSVLEGII